jgi:hypothetical protein
MMARNWHSLTGQVVGQKYRLAELIGANTGQAWFRAEDVMNGHSENLTATVQTQPFAGRVMLQELRHQQLRHILASGDLDVAGTSGRYAILENTGESLRSALQRGPLNVDEARELARDVLAALQYLHGQGLVFCGLRPECVSRGPAGWVLSDYEWVHHEGTADPSETRPLLTSSPHVPPDAFNGMVSPAWDVWSFGVLLNQALLPETTRRDRRHRHPPAPAPFDAVIRGCLNPDPSQRSTIAEISRLLDITTGAPSEAGGDLVPVRESLERPPALDVRTAPAPAVDTAPAPEQQAATPKRKSRVYGATMVETASATAVPLEQEPPPKPKPVVELPPLPRKMERHILPEPEPRRRHSLFAGLAVAALATGALLGVFQTRRAGEIVVPNPPGAAEPTKPQPAEAGAADRALAPAPAAVDPAVRRAAIQPFLNRWVATTRELNLEKHVATYAPVVEPFFKNRRAAISEVRAEKQKLFRGVSEVRKFDIRDVRVESFDPERAVVTFRKDWDLRGSRRTAGAERQRLTLGWMDGGWKIIGEQEIRIYWSRG